MRKPPAFAAAFLAALAAALVPADRTESDRAQQPGAPPERDRAGPSVRRRAAS